MVVVRYQNNELPITIDVGWTCPSRSKVYWEIIDLLNITSTITIKNTLHLYFDNSNLARGAYFSKKERDFHQVIAEHSKNKRSWGIFPITLTKGFTHIIYTRVFWSALFFLQFTLEYTTVHPNLRIFLDSFWLSLVRSLGLKHFLVCIWQKVQGDLHTSIQSRKEIWIGERLGATYQPGSILVSFKQSTELCILK